LTPRNTPITRWIEARLRLGTLVTGIHYRHPAVLANMAAALDIISGGRLELGSGRLE
jgi:alkanesulfonate monooxygenase SsuD/methylene tetrahydromethanopterin reductase-like flavin-dependent oxidoreductase (luciferase family)